MPKNARVNRDPVKSTDNNINTNYANRWRFIETVTTRNSGGLATAVKIEGYYTPPHYKSLDAKNNRPVVKKSLENDFNTTTGQLTQNVIDNI